MFGSTSTFNFFADTSGEDIGKGSRYAVQLYDDDDTLLYDDDDSLLWGI